MECWPLISLLHSARPVYGFQARGLDDGLAPREDVEDIARAYVDHLRRVQPQGPYSLWGFSFGGVVALEIGRLLAQAGERVQHVGLIDTYVRQDLQGWRATRDAIHRTARRVRHQSPRELGAYVLEHLAGKPAAISVPAGASPEQRRVHEAMSRALERYRPQPYQGGPVVYLRAAVPLGGYADPLPVWQRTATVGLVVMPLPGGHLDLVRKTSAYAARAMDDLLGD
jgi:acetoacetyl-CoA synthetase